MSRRTRRRRLLQVAAVVRRLAWAVFRPRTVGAQILVIDSESRVLLVNHSYERDVLRLPGGGAKRSESLDECAARELREETGLEVQVDRLELLGLYSGSDGARGGVVAVYVAPPGSWSGEAGLSPETDSAEFHPVSALPEDTSPATRARIDEFAAGRRGITGRWDPPHQGEERGS